MALTGHLLLQDMMMACCSLSVARYLSLTVCILCKIVSGFASTLSLYESQLVVLGSLKVTSVVAVLLSWKHVYL
jgi:hypothetical protein